MGKVELDREEADLLDSYESGEWHPIDTLEAKALKYREYARATSKKDRRVNSGSQHEKD